MTLSGFWQTVPGQLRLDIAHTAEPGPGMGTGFDHLGLSESG